MSDAGEVELPLREASSAPPSLVALAPRLEAALAGEVLEMVARGGEDLDPAITPAGDFLRWL